MNQKGSAHIWIILGLILVVAAVGGIFFLARSDKSLQTVSKDKEGSVTQTSKEVNKFIISNPVDLTQIKKNLQI